MTATAKTFSTNPFAARALQKYKQHNKIKKITLRFPCVKFVYIKIPLISQILNLLTRQLIRSKIWLIKKCVILTGLENFKDLFGISKNVFAYAVITQLKSNNL